MIRYPHKNKSSVPHSASTANSGGQLGKRAGMLQAKIQQELGIDMQRYAKPEAIEALANLFSFPQYVVRYMLQPLGFAIVLYVLGFFFLDLVHLEYMFYATLALVLLLATAFLFGLLALGWKMEKDLRSVVEYTLGMLDSVMRDVQRAGMGINQKNFRPMLTLLFQGMMHIVTIPILSQILSDRIPLIGGLFSRFMERLLGYVSDRFGQAEAVVQATATAHSSSPENWLNTSQASIQSLSNGLSRLLQTSRRIAQWPLKVAFAITSLLLVAWVWALH